MNDSSNMDLECSICFDTKSVDKITFLPCIHFLCSQCYEQLKKNECPFCKNKLREEEEEDSYDETENEYHDTEFEMLIAGSSENRRRRKNKKMEKRIMKIMKNNNEVIISIGRRNTYEILSSMDN